MPAIKRTISKKIKEQLYKGKVIVLYGARRVGKTTIVKDLVKEEDRAIYLNCELEETQVALDTTNSQQLKNFLGSYKVVVLDEAQHIKDIGLKLKIIHDMFPEIQLVATGSSSFDLGNQIGEPLTGRSRFYELFPISLQELKDTYNPIELNGKLNHFLRFGLYPDIIDAVDQECKEELSNIANNYLYKDVLMYEEIRHPDLLVNLLRALALQLGGEVSLNNLANLLQVNLRTVRRYIELLKKTFVIFELPAFSTNKRNEINKNKKYYFYDIGIRNTLINNHNRLTLRNDIEALWENFCIVECIKNDQNNRKFSNYFFWRNYQKQEIDYIEERDGFLHAFEFKYSKNKAKIPAEFKKYYPDHKYKLITKNNYLNHLIYDNEQ